MSAPGEKDRERARSFLRRVSSSYVGGFDFVHGLLSEMLDAVREEGRQEVRATLREIAHMDRLGAYLHAADIAIAALGEDSK